jgi:hypothetical protein
MELDEFKTVLQSDKPEERIHLSADELQRYIHTKTTSITGKIKRSILFESAVGVLFIVIAVWAWFSYPGMYVRPFSLLAAGLCCFFFIYLVALYRKMNVYANTSPAVKENLQQVIDILQQFIKLYFQLAILILLIAFIFGLITGYLRVTGDTAIKKFNWTKAIWIYLGWFFIWSLITYYFSKWYIKRLYGNYLEQLKEQLKDLENG